jgi:hypothetical protein
MMRNLTRRTGAVLVVVLLASGACRASSLTITPNFTNGTDDQKKIFNQAIQDWLKCLMAPKDKDVKLSLDVTFADLGAGTAASTSTLRADANGLPKSAKIQVSTNADMFYGTGAVPKDQYDALTAIRHELGHALGFNALPAPDNYDKWTARIKDDQFKMDDGTFVTLAGKDAAGQSHLPDSVNDLMSTSLGTDTRRDVSNLDLRMLSVAFGYEVCPEPSSLVLAGVSALCLAGYARRRRPPAAA